MIDELINTRPATAPNPFYGQAGTWVWNHREGVLQLRVEASGYPLVRLLTNSNFSD
jgi:hypothetical protein